MMGDVRYWFRMEDVRAEVEPLPFVPAMCITLRAFRSRGFRLMELDDERRMEGMNEGRGVR